MNAFDVPLPANWPQCVRAAMLEEGDRALVRIPEPVNRFPAFVRYIVRRLKVLCPTMGKKRIAEILARAGLHLGSITVGRMLSAKVHKPDNHSPVESALRRLPPNRVVTARHPNHVWHVDLTVVPTSAGFPVAP